jgi:hypothetical protein
MKVFSVIWGTSYEGTQLLGLFSDLEKAKSFQESYYSRNAIAKNSDSEWVEVRRVEIDKVYSDFDEVGEEMFEYEN